MKEAVADFNGQTYKQHKFGGTMATVDKGGTVTLQELLVTSLAQTDAVAKLLIEKASSLKTSSWRR